MKKGLHAVLVWMGGGALLLATLIDTLAMIGRHVNLPLIGSIEAVQAAVLIASSGALLMATAFRKHARVHLLQRLNEGMQRGLDVMHGVASILVVLALLVGSAWLTMDLWDSHEESELLRIPWLPLRLIVLVMLLSLLLVLLRQLLRRRQP